MPESSKDEFINGLINLCALYNVFGSENLSYDSSRVTGHMTEGAKEQTKESLLKLVEGNPDWQFWISKRSIRIEPGISTTIDVCSLNDDQNLNAGEGEFYSLLGEDIETEFCVWTSGPVLNIKNPYLNKHSKPYVVLVNPIFIQQGQIIGIMHRKPKLEIHNRLALSNGSAEEKKD